MDIYYSVFLNIEIKQIMANIIKKIAASTLLCQVIVLIIFNGPKKLILQVSVFKFLPILIKHVVIHNLNQGPTSVTVNTSCVKANLLVKYIKMMFIRFLKRKDNF